MCVLIFFMKTFLTSSSLFLDGRDLHIKVTVVDYFDTAKVPLCMFWQRLIMGVEKFVFQRLQVERQTSAGVTYKIHSGCQVITQTLSQHFSIKPCYLQPSETNTKVGFVLPFSETLKILKLVSHLEKSIKNDSTCW